MHELKQAPHGSGAVECRHSAPRLAFDERSAPRPQGPELTHTSEKLDPSLERLDGTAFDTLGLLPLTMLIW